MKLEQLFAFTLSISLHVLILFFITQIEENYTKVADPGNLYYPVEIRLIKKENLEVYKESASHGESDNVGPSSPAVVCKEGSKEYSGVGLIYDLQSHIVMVAPVYFPAYKAGIREGDLILNIDAAEINGYIDFEIERNGIRFRIKIKTETICFED